VISNSDYLILDLTQCQRGMILWAFNYHEEPQVMSNPATFTATERASVIRYRTTVAIPSGYDALQPLAAAASGFVEQVNTSAAQFRDEALPGALLSLTGSMMFQAGRNAHSAALTHKRAHQKADEAFRRAPEGVNAAHHPERRLRYRGLKEADAVRAVAAADLADLAALVVNGNLANLPAPVFEQANERYLEAVVMARPMTAQNYTLKPTAANPLADGLDETAARRAAEAIIAGHRADADAIAVHERTLRDWTTLLATSFGLSPDDVFQRALGR